jgi:hypothetical protein
MNTAIAEITEVETRALSVPDQAKAITITDNATYEKAAEILLVIKDIRKEISDTFTPIKRKMDAAKKEVLDQEKRADIPLQEAEGIIKPKIAAYLAEQERIRKAEEDRLRAIAKKEEEDRRLAEAASLEAAGETEAAEEVISEPVYVPPPVVASTVSKVAGVAMRETWTYEIVDEKQLPRQYLIPDEKAIRAAVNSLHERCNIPGVRVYTTTGIAAGRR